MAEPKHPRRLIRDAVHEMLKSATTSHVDGRVFKNRSRKIDDHLRPCLVLYALRDTPEQKDQSPRTYLRDLALFVDVYAKNTAEATSDDAVDDLSRAVEETFATILENALELFPDPLLIDLGKSDLGDTEIGFDERGFELSGHARVSMNVVYEDRAPSIQDEAVLDKLERIHVDIDLEGGEPVDTGIEVDLT